ncbi:ATP-binding protein [Verrucomicrobiales bacterium]|nr:ATP-binding protein [Verrucomicrobiales bacterium]
MSVFTEIQKERSALRSVLTDPTIGMRKLIIEEFYPDKAHFIYELLQNAEDTGATEVTFSLEPKLLVFEHDGKPFTKNDVLAITNVGSSDKEDNEDQIGRFGIGFKAVFGYTKQPRIFSRDFNFKISDMVWPEELPPADGLGNRTRFEFPLGGENKDPIQAYEETKEGLDDFNEITLLFLNNIQSIHSQIGDTESLRTKCINHDDGHIEILNEVNGESTSKHYLRFKEPVKNDPNLFVSIAFELSFLKDIDTYDKNKPVAQQLKVKAANPGMVAVFLPCVKEQSGLRFHLHAPLLTPISRDSVKDTPQNEPFRDQLAELSARSLEKIRDLELLTVDFLKVLPLPATDEDDELGKFYVPIRESIVNAMDHDPLTPTASESHAPAKVLFLADRSMKKLITSDDLAELYSQAECTDNEGKSPPDWVAPAPRSNRAGKFIQGLQVTNLEAKKFIENLIHALTYYAGGDYQQFYHWHRAKDAKWHLKLYSFLYTELINKNESWNNPLLNQLKSCEIVIISKADSNNDDDGTHNKGSECYFSGDVAISNPALNFVDPEAHSPCDNESTEEAKRARQFLEKIGVNEVGEKEQVEAILEERYNQQAFEDSEERPAPETRLKDLKRFIALVSEEPDTASIFKPYFILQDSDNDWCTPEQIFIDDPFEKTWLSAYHEAIKELDEKSLRYALSPSYLEMNVDTEQFIKFAEKVGASTQLIPMETDWYNNPNEEYLSQAPGATYTDYSRGQDYIIKHLDSILENNNIELSRAVWNSMNAIDDEFDGEEKSSSWLMPVNNPLHALNKKNDANAAHYCPSQLVFTLREKCWIPQKDGENIKFVCPANADSKLLPPDFDFTTGAGWLQAIKFGSASDSLTPENPDQEIETSDLMEKLEDTGFTVKDEEDLKRLKEFSRASPEKQEQAMEYVRAFPPEDLPVKRVNNPERRKVKVQETAKKAPRRETTQRKRAISKEGGKVRKEAATYLSSNYTNHDNIMICQVCERALPFKKLEDNKYYFESVEFLGRLKNHHKENYLALCANHAAMYKHANPSKDDMLELFNEIEDNKLRLKLADNDEHIYFTEAHLADLRAVLTTEDEN